MPRFVMRLKDGTHIGELSFKGIDLNGAAEIGYGISTEYKGKGYAAGRTYHEKIRG